MPISRSLFVESKKLRVFDMDDTLITTTSYIYVDNEKSGKKFKLTPGEYAVYTAKDGDVFDYSDFQKIQNPKIIKGYFELLRRMASMGGKDRGVYILTARGAYKPIHKFIKDSGIRGVYVVALGDSNPEKKADWIENKVKDEGYDDVFFVDDSPKNIEAVKKRLKKYPNVKQKIQIVKHSGDKNESIGIKLMNIL
jgi:phosphoglycolate phosphatase-like HAD superfamily hydrolase